MDQKRSKGVTIFAILIVIGGILNLLTDFYYEFNTAPIWRIIICSLLHFTQIICAIGILKLKELARKITIYVYTILVFWVPFLLLVFTSKKLMETLKSVPMDIPLKTRDFIINASLSIALTIAIVSSILWFIAVIYFFTRQRVKEQFH